jgi:hypothetical protein
VRIVHNSVMHNAHTAHFTFHGPFHSPISAMPKALGFGIAELGKFDDDGVLSRSTY